MLPEKDMKLLRKHLRSKLKELSPSELSAASLKKLGEAGQRAVSSAHAETRWGVSAAS